MRKQLIACGALALLAACATKTTPVADNTFTNTGNPLIKNNWTSDPAPMVYGDSLYLYVGHDDWNENDSTKKGQYGYNLVDWLCYSTADMQTWTYHGVILKPTDFKWAVGEAWAAQVVEKGGKFYYFVSTQSQTPCVGKAIGVAVSDSPTGPFVDAIGAPLVCDTMTDNGPRGWWNDIDPTVLVDGDDVWMSWGNGSCFIAKLKPNMIELDGEIRTVDLPQYIEGPWLSKRNDMYYLTYASMGKSGEALAYATAPSMDSTWTPQGEVTGAAENSFTIHPGLADFKGKSYLFYHNGTLDKDSLNGCNGRRSVCVEELTYRADGLMDTVRQTKQGISIIK